MNGNETSIAKSPKWIAVLSSISLGWLILVISTFFSLIASAAFLDSLNKSVTSRPAIYTMLAVASLLGILLGSLVGKKSYQWFCDRKRSTGIILFIILVILALGSIPQPFTFVSM